MSDVVSVRKILQALYYIQNNAPSTNESRFNLMFLLKIMFFADRYHLRTYGCLATGDTYFAMKQGPVASAAFDILRNSFPPNANRIEENLLNNVEAIDEHSVLIKCQAEDELSESFKEALNFALEHYGSYNHFDLSDISHDYPEWKKHEKQIHGGIKRVEMDIDDFFDNPKNLDKSKRFGIKNDPYEEDDKFIEVLREQID